MRVSFVISDQHNKVNSHNARKVQISIAGVFACTSYVEFGREGSGISTPPLYLKVAEAALLKNPEASVRLDFLQSLASQSDTLFRPVGLPKISISIEDRKINVNATVNGLLSGENPSEDKLNLALVKSKSPISFVVSEKSNRYNFSCVDGLKRECRHINDFSQRPTVSLNQSKFYAAKDAVEGIASKHPHDERISVAVKDKPAGDKLTVQERITAPESYPAFRDSVILVTYEFSLLSESWINDFFESIYEDEMARKCAAEYKLFLEQNEYYKDLVRFRSSATASILRQTYRWTGNSRLLPISRIRKFDNARDNYIEELKLYRRNFLQTYPLQFNAFRASRQNNFKERYTVPADLIETEIQLYITFSSISCDDFPRTISESERFIISKVRDEQYTFLRRRAFRDFRFDLEQLITKVLESVQEAQADGRRPKLYESTFNRLKEVAEVEQLMNFESCTAVRESSKLIRDSFHSITVADLRAKRVIRVDVRRCLELALNYLMRREALNFSG